MANAGTRDACPYQPVCEIVGCDRVVRSFPFLIQAGPIVW